MVRIGVVSDSHGHLGNVAQMKRECGRLDWLLHAGDHFRDAARVAAMLGLGRDQVRAVLGNCDYGSTGPEELVLEIAGVRILMVHGHRYGIKAGLQRLDYRAQEVGARVAIFGHSHVALLADVGGILFLNPGSLSEPRRSPDLPSCAVIEVSEGQLSAKHIFFS